MSEAKLKQAGAALTWIYNGHSYGLFKTAKTWNDASSFAKSIGGYLTKVDDNNENKSIYAKVSTSFSTSDQSKSMAPDGGQAAYVWLGASDSASEGSWKWAKDNATLATTRSEWGAGTAFGSYIKEPDNSYNQDFLALGMTKWPNFEGYGKIGSPGQWNDVQGGNTLYFVVEMDAITNKDTTAPKLVSLTPTDNAKNVAVNANFVLKFSETVKAGTGSFVIKSGSKTVATIAANDNSQVTYSGSTVTINPKSDLANNTSYSVTAASEVITDSAGNKWTGTGSNPYDFTTILGSKYWTKLLGSSSFDFTTSLTTGTDGAIYVAGSTTGNLDGQSNKGSEDAFITKYKPDGTKVWTKMLGTSGNDSAYALTTGADGAIYVAGYTQGNLDGQSNNGEDDVFVTKYNSDGAWAWTKLLGTSVSGSSDERAHALTTGADGAIYVAGFTTGNLDGQSNQGGLTDAFVTKYKPDGTKVWTKLLGTSSYEEAYGLTTGTDGAIYVAGDTEGDLDGQGNKGSYDSFIMKLNDIPSSSYKPSAQKIAKVGSVSTDKLSSVGNITGSKNSDVLTGNDADNVISGDAGADTLTGGLGSDSLYGGSDKIKDVFDFNAIAESKTGTARDKVYDFVTKIDKIDLSGIDANTAKTKAGDQAFLFNNTTAKANSVWYKVADVDGDKKSNDLIIYGDVDGNTKADFEIGLVGVVKLVQADFVL